MFLIPLFEWFWHPISKNPDTYATRNIFAYLGFQNASKTIENIINQWVRTGVVVLSSLVNLGWMHTTVFMGVSLSRLYIRKWLCQCIALFIQIFLINIMITSTPVWLCWLLPTDGDSPNSLTDDYEMNAENWA